MNTTFEFNGLTYMVTSSIRLGAERKNKQHLFNFSLAIVDPKSNRKQLSLNCLTLVHNQEKNYHTIHSPMHMYLGGKCASVSFIPDTTNTVQNLDRSNFISKLIPILTAMAAESIKNKRN